MTNNQKSTERVVTDISRCHQALSPPLPTRVCAYVRVSTHHEGQQNSLNNQTDYYAHKLSTLPGSSYIGVFSDAGVSGATMNRPGFQAMLKMARAGEIDLIYTKSISRLARSTLLLLQIVRELRDLGVGIIFEELNINTLKSEGELMLTVLASIAEEERKSVRANVKWALQKKCLRGEVMVNTNRLLGYDMNVSRKLIINPEQADIVRQIYKMYLGGVSGYRIAQILNDLNIPTYATAQWQSHRILSIISNEKYAGSCLMQKSFVNESGRLVPNRGEQDQYWIDDSHPAIVTQPDWDRAQIIRSKRVKKTYPFTSLLRCPFCGSSLIRVGHSGLWISWICGRYLRQGKSICIGSRITEARLLEMIKEHPITEPMIVEEVQSRHDTKSKRQKNYRFIPVFGYSKEQGND